LIYVYGMCGQALSCGNAQGRRQIKSAGDDDSLERLGVNTLIGNKEWHWRWANANAKMHSIEMQVPRGCESQGGRRGSSQGEEGKNYSQANWLCKLCAKWLLQRAATNKRANRAVGGILGVQMPPDSSIDDIVKGAETRAKQRAFLLVELKTVVVAAACSCTLDLLIVSVRCVLGESECVLQSFAVLAYCC